MVDRPEDPRRLFPGWPAPVPHIMTENQGVCEWGVPLDGPDPDLWAQADELDDESLAYLRARFEEVLPTTAFPATTSHRFQDGTSRVMPWSGAGGCEWRISGTDMVALEGLTRDLRCLSNLRQELWCGDEAGDALLARLRAE